VRPAKGGMMRKTREAGFPVRSHKLAHSSKPLFTMKLSKHYIFTTLLSLLLISCASQPRYRSESVENRSDKIITEEETTVGEKSKIDQKKMGRIIKSFLGVPYQLGGETKVGMDCSGLVVAVYKQYAGFALPHDTQKLFKLVKNVDKGDLSYGDLVFFSNGWLSASHVGIYIGEGKFVHSIVAFGVIVSSLDEDYYKKRYIGARRVIP
jgi:lipoprotein Spr